MKRTMVTWLLLTFCGLTGFAEPEAQELEKPPTKEEDAASQPESEDPELWFPVGEKLIYKGYWGVIPVSYSTATTEWIEEDGRKLLAVRFRTKSNKFLSKIYPVDDFLESIIDPETFLPIRFTKQLSEGKYRTDEVTTFDFKTLKARWFSRKNGNEKIYDIEEDTRDLIAFMYFMRSKPLKVGDAGEYQVMADEKIFDLNVKVSKKEKFKLKHYGKVKSLKVEPEAEFEGLFVRTGKLYLWVSDDARRILTKMQLKIPVASIKLKLLKALGPGDDSWITDLPEKERAKEEKDDENEDKGEAEEEPESQETAKEPSS